MHIKNHNSISPDLKPLLEALATQCFLNEYVYWQSDEEQQWINDLMKIAKKSQGTFNEYLPIIACYQYIHNFAPREEISKYTINSDESKALTYTQYNEFITQSIKARLSH